MERALRIVLMGACLHALLLVGSVHAAEDDVLRIGVEPGIGTLDPHIAATSMELHVAEALFEGLVIIDPRTLRPAPGLATDWSTSEDGLTWTFRLRENARWSDGTPLGAADVARSLRRALAPTTGAEFAYMLEGLRGARAWRAYGRAVLALTGPRGLIASLRRWSARFPDGVDRATWSRWIGLDSMPDVLRDAPEPLVAEAVRATRARWSAADLAQLATNLETAEARLTKAHAEAAERFGRSRGVVAVDARTLRIELEHPHPLLLELLAMPIAAPVPPSAFETGGSDDATKDESGKRRRRPASWWRVRSPPVSGPYRVLRRTRGAQLGLFGVQLVRNDAYHGVSAIRQARIDVVAVKDAQENLRRFTSGEFGWVTSWPREVTKALASTGLLRSTDGNIVYYYLLRCDHPALGDARVRKALATSVDRAALLREVPGVAGTAAATFVPAALPGYTPPAGGLAFDPKAARALLEAAVPKGGAGLPPLELVYNVSESHRAIATFVASQWREHLGVRVTLVPLTWSEYQVRKLTGEFAVARAGWIGDFADPVSFLALFRSGGVDNHARWSDPAFDRLLAKARLTTGAARLALLAEAEARLLTEGAPCVPLYWYRLADLVHPWVRGFRTRAVGKPPEAPGAWNVQGLHPFRGLWIERAESDGNGK